MKQIVKYGGAREPHIQECPNCNCVFTFNHEDVYWKKYMLYHCVECPNCGYEISLGDLDNGE